MHDDSGSAQQSGWQPPEYVSPWIPVSSSGDEAHGASNAISFGPAGQAYGSGYGYGPGDGQPPWGGYGAPPPPPPPHHGVGRALAYLAVAVIAAGAGAGAAIALSNSSSSAPSATAPVGGGAGAGGTQFSPYGGPGAGGAPTGSAGTGGGANSGTGSLNAGAIAARVDPGIVDITSELKYSNATAEGTGMIISSSGLVLTNNHVIDQATRVSATLVVSGKSYTAHVIGYDSTDDVALLQLVGASGLQTVSLADSSQVTVGTPVLALGNAGGQGGLPSTAQGTIQGLNQSISASDSSAGTTENLHGMLATNAPIQQGDSGGPLVDGNGQVVGMDTAANAPAGYSGQSAATTGFAIPINRAITITSEIHAGQASATVHLGLVGFLGVNVTDAATAAKCVTGSGFGGVSPAVSSGALICSVYNGTPADSAGLTGGDVITSVNGKAIGTADALTSVMSGDRPGSQLTITYVDQTGTERSASVTLSGLAR